MSKSNFVRKQCITRIVGMMVLLFATTVHGEPLKPVPGEFTATLQGVDPSTGELILEGPKTGAIPGLLTIRAAITKQTGVALHLAARWSLTTPWGETIQGENTGVLNTSSLHFREHGVIVEGTGSLAERVGNFIVIRGDISDLNFIPGVTQVSGHATYVPSQAKRPQ